MEIILFELGGSRFGLPASAATQVSAPPVATPLPFTPDFVEGLVSVNGEVAPQINLGARLTGAWIEAAGDVALMVETPQERFAMRVDRVLMILDLDDAHILTADEAAADAAFVAGRFSHDDALLPLLNVTAIGLTRVAPVGLPEGGGAVLATAAADRGEDRRATAVEEDRFRCLIVRLGGARYALPLNRVQEVVDGGDCAATPGAPDAVEGVLSLRGRPVLVVSLGRLLDEEVAKGRQIVLVESGGAPIGLAVERIEGLRGFALRELDEASSARLGLDGYVNENSGEMIGVVDIDALTGAPELRAHIPQTDGDEERRMQATETRKFLTFWVGAELCGVDLAQVMRVHDYRAPNAVPADAGEIRGVTEIGGDVLPVLDLRRSLKVDSEDTPMTAQVVIDVKGHSWSVVVDRLNRIVEIPVDQIKPSGSTQAQYLAEIGRIEDNLVSLLDLAPLEQAA